MLDVRDVDRREFRGGARLWRRQTSFRAVPLVFGRKDWGWKE